VIYTKFTKEMDGRGFCKKQPVVAVGVSGGSDSIALLFMMHEWMRSVDGKVIALTVDHRLRDESESEAQDLSARLKEHGIEHHILVWNHAEVSSNIQSKARIARRELLTGWCQKNNVRQLFLAHTKDDVAETFLMRCFRGSGVAGLAAIAKTTVHNGIEICRPLLSFSKEELRTYLIGRNIEWVEDSSNTNPKFMRTKIRNLIKIAEEECGPLIDKLVLNANNLARTRAFIEAECDKVAAKIVKLFPEGFITIKQEEFCNLDEELALNVLASSLITISGRHVYKPRLNSLEGLYREMLLKKHPIKTLWDCEIKASKGMIFIYREVPKYGFTVERISKTSWIWDSRFKIDADNDDIIKMISSFDLTKTGVYDKKKYNSLPKKIWHSLPLITTKSGEHYIPFLCPKLDGIKVIFFKNTNLEIF